MVSSRLGSFHRPQGPSLSLIVTGGCVRSGMLLASVQNVDVPGVERRDRWFAASHVLAEHQVRAAFAAIGEQATSLL